MDICPLCGKEFDEETDQIVMCPVCGNEGSTACCHPGGRNCICPSCECNYPDDKFFPDGDEDVDDFYEDETDE